MKPAKPLALLGAAVKATECYVPSFDPPPLRLRFETRLPASKLIGVRDLVVAPAVFTDSGSLFEKMTNELSSVRSVQQSELFVALHKGSHQGTTYLGNIIEERWLAECPTVSHVMHQLASFFNLTIRRSRLNWFQTSENWKPFHHDAHAFASSADYGHTKSTGVNFSAIASFGATRALALQHSELQLPTGSFSVDLHCGSVIGIARDTNILWRHAILQGERSNIDNLKTKQGRISVVLNGWVEQQEESIAKFETR